ncbi:MULTISPECIES: hypothetical protein [Sphingobacterium]|uniref:Uncharacterized protein n=1 Tax=Sphingobacterium populi TaxID=1812824 RepID=A0ABW5UEK0_9SPHI|nr:hypothetical protein [Sphingobacterium sp. CFCC 11742]
MKAGIYLVLISGLLLFVGCSEKLLENPRGSTSLRVDVEGVSGAININSNTTARAVDNSITTGSGRSSESLGNTSGFQVDFVTDQNLIESHEDEGFGASFVANKHTQRSTQSRASTPMQQGYTYRILLYNKNTGELWQTFQGSAGTSLSIEAQRGVTYLWYAYSYNNTENLSAPSNGSNPEIATAVDKDLLYAHGELTIPAGTQTDFPLGITFEHKVAQVHIKVDATVLARFATINNLNVSFDNPNYIKRGVFNIKDNQMNAIEVVPTETIFNSASSTNIWEASYFTADPSAVSTYRIVVNDLPVRFDGVNENIANRNLATYFGAANRPTFTSNFPNAAFGQRLSTIANLNYVTDPLRILHISNNASYGYALQRGPSWEFLNSQENFGNLPQSIVKMAPWAAGQGSWIGGNANNNTTENWLLMNFTNAFDNQLAARLSANNTTNRPDIVIFGYNFTEVRPVVATALLNYLNDNGVVIMMYQNGTGNNSISFFNQLFGVSNTGLSSYGSGGAMYSVVGTDIADPILNGPFGDVRNTLWGEDAGTTIGVTNVPPSQATIYSLGQPINRNAQSAMIANRATMFKHNTKSFFFVGDGGFVSYTGGTFTTIGPFNYDNISKRPLSKPYGDNGAGYVQRSRDAYNSIIMANVMAWAVKKAELEGIKTWKYEGPPTP